MHLSRHEVKNNIQTIRKIRVATEEVSKEKNEMYCFVIRKRQIKIRINFFFQMMMDNKVIK